MGPEEKHPYIERPSIKQLSNLLENKTPTMRNLYLDIHRLMLQTLPDVVYSVDCKDGMLGYGARQYGYDGWGMVALAAHSKWVSLMFMLGAVLEDPDKVLEGTGKKMRHAKIRSPKQFEEKRSVLQALIKAASKVNQEV